jgi:hypothetical protein
MPRMKAFLTIIFLSILPFILSCHHTVQPPGDCTPPLPTETTSHSFIWRLDTLGAGNGSVLNDVAIMNDTLAYAVGEIYLKDSTGQFDPLPYNLVRWDGQRWKLERVTVNFRGNFITPPLEGVFAFSPTPIWLVGSLPIYGDGMNWTMYDLRTTLDPNVSLSKAWGSSPSSMYFVGRGGTMVRFSAGTWQKLESRTTIDIQDIWGGVNCRGETEILAVASQGIQVPPGKKLLRIQGTTVTAVADTGLPLPLQSVWFAPLQQYFIGGDGLYRTNSIGSSWQRAVQLNHYVFSVRGLAANDIVVAGGFGGVSHFNGATWEQYMGSEVPQMNGNYYAAAIHPRLIAAVGGIVGGKAIALIGKR